MLYLLIYLFTFLKIDNATEHYIFIVRLCVCHCHILKATYLDLYGVCVIQVKVALKSDEKLIVMISLSIHMMTSQDRICVQCVTNGIQRKEISNYRVRQIKVIPCRVL